MSSNYDELWLKTVNEGIEDRVEVNQRMLIDKMLARYSSDFVVYRELIQNSDDAQSTSFTLEITCDPTSATESYESPDKDDSSNYLLGGVGQFLKAPWAWTATKEKTDDSFTDISPPTTAKPPENDFHNCLITEIRTINNGNVFTEDDWKRVITIAEGNTNVDAIGQFGVGFFSVFSYSERPMIQSGKHRLAFVWQNGKSLTTFRKELSSEEQSASTSVILSMKNKYILQTKASITENSNTNSNTRKKGKRGRNRAAKSTTNTATNEIVPTMDLPQLKAYFTKVLAFTKHINELIIKINGLVVFQVNKTAKISQSTKLSSVTKRMNTNNENNLLRFKSFVQTEQTFTIQHGPSITLNHIDVEAQVIGEKEFHQQIERVLKKSLPKTIHIEFLFPSNNIFQEKQWQILANDDPNTFLLKGLIPLKLINGQINPAGQIFIGLATHQTTGIGMHVFSHLIPTIERENIDLQDPYISIWNDQLLISIGQIVRFIYDQTMADAVEQATDQTHDHFNAILSPYAFQESSPNKEIGRILVDGFFSSDKDILVPVRRSPTDTHLVLVPSTEAFLTKSKHIEKFLSIPIVPYEIGKHDFFKILKQRQWIEEIDNDTITKKIQETILLVDEFIGLLRWLCTNDIYNKSFIKEILSKIRFRHTRQSPIIKLTKIQYFDTFNLPSLPLPSDVLPSDVVSHLARDDLQRRLSLSPVSIKHLVEFYLADSQHHLFLQDNTSKVLLSFISHHWNKFSETESTRIKTTLSNIKCIPTTQGMKSPNESYIPSASLSSNLPMITLYIPQIVSNKNETESKDHPVSIELVKSIGCRTIHIPTLSNNAQHTSNDSFTSDDSQTVQAFVQYLVQQRKNLSENDLRALKHNHCITGTTLESNGELKRRYIPSELHFPYVAQCLQWKNLLIVDWPDIEPRSGEYAFLKELGVREVPDLHKLLAHIDQEHHKGLKSRDEYKLPNALVFFAENFQQYYSKIWRSANNKVAFLPSSPPDLDASTDVILTTPDVVFKESGPLCPSLLPEVLRCFQHHFDIGLLGVKYRPSLPVAFDVLMGKRNQLLTDETAPKYFSYLNKLDGLNRLFIEKVSTIAFIPLPGTKTYVKPSQVFIRSRDSTSSSASAGTHVNIIDDIATHGLIDYVDYGYEANSFLLGIGVVSYPSAEVLAELLIERQAGYFSPSAQNSNDVLAGKLRVYINCLKQLAAVSHVARKFTVDPLRSRLINKPWCLGYQIIDRPDGSKDRIFKIAKPGDIYLDDDHQSAIDLRPLCAPDEPELTKLYEQFGANWISESVKRTLVHRGKFFGTDRSKKLYDLIHHRLDMLFVNNRGEQMEDIDAKRIELLRTKLHVYESEGIQCQLTFDNRTTTLNSTECSTCALEHDKNKVTLYIQKDIPVLDYIDIATELTRYVYKKPLDALVHSISDKLASSLETLKRRGIPVDRLLKTQEQQPFKLSLNVDQSTLEEKVSARASTTPNVSTREQKPSETSSEHHHHKQVQPEDDTQSSRSFLQSLKSYFVPPSTEPTNSQENRTSRVERDRVAHFGRYKFDDDTDINKMIRTSSSYSQRTYNQPEFSRNEVNNSCEFIPSTNMIRHEHLFHGIALYLDVDVILTDLMLEQSKHLSYLLSNLAKQVFRIPVETVHLFRDIDSARIAFNSDGALFFNLRYFEQVFWDDLKTVLPSASSSSTIVRTIVNFYFMVTCHELSHNIDSNHDLNFINRLERVSVRFMDAKETFASKFSFQ
ncbi:unnamed protein product [Adineta ricciae]|uniref:Sacsin/Nov domain-containing protein n=1 Tax=Adineta ricciae TaxID=249248 RepID=A0A815QHD7_ADIRI|nr:unnamed protein product [Adineta ricciae]